MSPRRAALAAFLDEMNVRVGALVVDEGAKALEFFRALQGVGPFAFITVDHQLHLCLQFAASPRLSSMTTALR
jgi:hypothetical protein